MKAKHPGEVIRTRLQQSRMPQKELADLLDMQTPHVSGLVNGKRHVSAMLALKLEKVIGLSARKWMLLQMDYDLERARDNQKVRRRLK